MSEDIDDLAHDADIDAGEKKGERRFRDCSTCTAPLDFGKSVASVCRQCELKAGVHPLTQRAFMLAELVEAGCVFTINDLEPVEWRALAMVRRAMKARSMQIET